MVAMRLHAVGVTGDFADYYYFLLQVNNPH